MLEPQGSSLDAVRNKRSIRNSYHLLFSRSFLRETWCSQFCAWIEWHDQLEMIVVVKYFNPLKRQLFFF